MDIEFGVFDHLDRGPQPLNAYYEDRLRLIEAYDAAGFYGYHIAEHHATPLGMAPSPGVFLSAVAQRTRQLRFGPLIYTLPLYHPLRMIEEICMLDHMSGGRMQMGFGRGAVPIELRYYGQDPAEAVPDYDEALAVVLAGLTQKSLTFHGKRYHFADVPMELAPLQQPHPPLWYGVHAPESAARCARNAINVVSLFPSAEVRPLSDRYREVWRETKGTAPLPKIGIGRMLVVAETDEAAQALAARAYPMWHRSFNFLFERHKRYPAHPRPAEFAGLIEEGRGIAGSPETVAAVLASQMEEAGANYFVGQFAFGDLTLGEAMRSVELFAAKVMPALRAV